MTRGLILVLFVFLGCESAPAGPGAALRVRTDRSSYAVDQAITVDMTNLGADTVFLPHCNFHVGMVVQAHTGAGWTDTLGLNGPMCVAIYPSGTIAVPGGSSHTETVALSRPGTYRMEIDAGPAPTYMAPVYSNEFEVR